MAYYYDDEPARYEDTYRYDDPAPLSGPVPQPEPRRASLPAWVVPTLIALMVSLPFLAGGLYLYWEATNPEAETERAYRLREAGLKAEADAAGRRLADLDIPPSVFRDVATRVGPAVVNISHDGRNVGHAEGSGVIVRLDEQTKQAYVITNNHVVQNAGRLGITLQSGRTIYVEREHVVTDPHTDLALIRFPAENIPLVVADFGDSDLVQPGDWVLAIGSPFGLKQSITAGIISAKGRANMGIGGLDDVELIQTDAAINPGNSGGPLLDLKGRIIGINTAIFSKNGGFQGVGFAIPSKTATRVFEQLAVRGEVVRGYLGILMQPVAEEDLQRLGIAGGVRIEQFRPASSSPARKAGLEIADVIVQFNGKEVADLNQLRRMVMETAPGTTVPVEVVRQEGDTTMRKTYQVTVGQRPGVDSREEPP